MKGYSNLTNLQKDIFAGKTTCLNLVLGHLDRIKKKKDLNIFLEVFNEDAIAISKKIDEKIKNKTSGKLAGLIVGLKDNICYKNHFASASSKILQNFESLYSATVVKRLIKEVASS